MPSRLLQRCFLRWGERLREGARRQSNHGQGPIKPLPPPPQQQVGVEIGKYCVVAGSAVVGWYCIALAAKHAIPPEDRPPHKPFLSRCTVTAEPLEHCGLPSPALLQQLGREYGFQLGQAAWAACHLCPLELHVILVEHLITERVVPVLQKLIPPDLRSALDGDPAAAASKREPQIVLPATTFPPHTQRPENSEGGRLSLAHWVLAVLEHHLEQLKTDFPVADVFRHVAYEQRFQRIFQLIERLTHTDGTPKTLTWTETERAVRETLRKVLYEYLVANWEASRYFDPMTYREGLFGPRRTCLSEGVDIGTRGASALALDKPHLRIDAYPTHAERVLRERTDNAEFEQNCDRTFLSEPSREARLHQFDLHKVGKLPGNLQQEYKKVKKGKKNFLNGPLDSFEYKASLDYLPNKEDPYAQFLSSDAFGPRGLPFATLTNAARMLRDYGVVRIQAAVSPEAVLHLRRKLFVSPHAGQDMGDKLIAVDNNIRVSRRSPARVTAYLRGSSFEPFLVELQRPWMPLLYARTFTEQYYGQKAVSQLLQSESGTIHPWNSEDTDDSANPPAVDSLPTRSYTPVVLHEGFFRSSTTVYFQPGLFCALYRLMCSAIQLTCQDRNAPDEGFAVDNASPSFTVLIALDAMKTSVKSPTGGAVQLMPGTHHIGTLKSDYKPRRLWEREWSAFFSVFFRSNGPVSVPLNPGDAVVWDSRLFRRMLANGQIATSNYLIFRYDFPSMPAPSQALPQLLSNKLKSRILFWGGIINRLAFRD